MNQFPQIDEVEEANTSDRLDRSERLQTEYTIDSSEDHISAIEKELQN